MGKAKKQFKKDFMEANKADLTFDLNKLKPNPEKQKGIKPYHPYRRTVIIATCVTVGVLALLAAPASLILSSMLRVDESVKLDRRSYNANEIKVAESNTFKKLNQVTYPSLESPQLGEITEVEEAAYNGFADATYRSLRETSKKDNMSYSPMGLYAIVNELVGASSREELTKDLNDLLGLDEDSRAAFYKKEVCANSYATENASTQLKNSAFFTHRFDYSQGYVDYLTKLYCEAYQIDFSHEADKMVEWANEAVNERGFVDSSFLDMDEETALYLFSTLYFKNAWANKYLTEDDVDDVFHLGNGQEITVKFMRHSYWREKYYDYGSYISFRDYYHSRASITYLIPKKVDDDIYSLTKGKNIFAEDENRAVSGTNGFITVSLKTPKFHSKVDMDFVPCLENLGFGDAFDRYIDSFHNAFTGEKADPYTFYLQRVKQRNEVEFNEDGSIVKSLSMASIGAGSAAPGVMEDTLEVELNQPFIYIIRDANDIPIFVGHLDNPKA